MNRNAIVWIVVIIILIVLGLILWGNTSMREQDLDVDITEEESNTSAGQNVGQNALTMGDQEPDANITASLAVLQSPGFVVVHERTALGTPGAVLGASALLPAGQSSNVAVPLSAPLTNGKVYIGMLHIDNGDGKPSEATDLAAKDVNGNPVIVEFMARM